MRLSENNFSPVRVKKGTVAVDNGRENIDPHIKTQVLGTKELTLSDGTGAGFVMNSADGVLSGGHGGAASVEGADVLSTGEVGASKFLREDGDGTCSWQAASIANGVTAAVPLTDGTIVQGDGGAEGVKTSTATVAQIATCVSHVADVTGDPHNIEADTLTFTNKTFDADGAGNSITNIENADIKAGAGIVMSKTAFVAGTNCTLATNTLNVDDAFLKNDAVDVGVGLTLTGDNSSADTAYVPMVLYNTDAVPPAASGFPIGTLYVQYTA